MPTKTLIVSSILGAWTIIVGMVSYHACEVRMENEYYKAEQQANSVAHQKNIDYAEYAYKVQQDWLTKKTEFDNIVEEVNKHANSDDNPVVNAEFVQYAKRCTQQANGSHKLIIDR